MTTRALLTPSAIALAGHRALVERLGAGGALAFIHQLESGEGNYVRERDAILKSFVLEDLERERPVRRRRERARRTSTVRRRG